MPLNHRVFWGLAASLLAAAGCAGTTTEADTAKGLGLPPWTGMDKDLFADEIDPAAMGMVASKSPRKDQTLWARAQQAEIVGRVRVQTVTVDTGVGDSTYHLGLQFANPLLADTKLEERVFEVTIEIGDPAYGLVKTQDTALQGRTFVGFIKRFATPDDEIDNHFYLAADSAEVAAVVQEAVAVKEVTR